MGDLCVQKIGISLVLNEGEVTVFHLSCSLRLDRRVPVSGLLHCVVVTISSA